MTKTKLGLGLVAAGMLAVAGSAQAASVDYQGLAFNSTDAEHDFFLRPYYFTGLSPNATMGQPRWRMDGNDLSNYGQAHYHLDSPGDVTGPGGLSGGTLTFSPGDPISMVPDTGGTPGSFDMSIVGGVLDIGGYAPNSSAAFDLPFGLGDDTRHDYFLDGYLDIALGGTVLTFNVLPEGDDYINLFFDYPYSGLNVGNNDTDLNARDGSTDLSMILYARADCLDDSCPFFRETVDTRVYEQSEWGEWYRIDGSCSWWKDNCKRRWKNGRWKYSKRDKEWETVRYCDKWRSSCRVTGQYIAGNDDVYIKIALWGESTDAPEPATLSLFALGLAGLGAAARRRRHAA
ncbi:MAG: PEP-CTERM sorting domain-containing protein [Alphaproteobacteria bacterium]